MLSLASVFEFPTFTNYKICITLLIFSKCLGLIVPNPIAKIVNFRFLRYVSYICRRFNGGNIMKATISMESLWQTISSLSLNNRKWLAQKLMEDIEGNRLTEAENIAVKKGLKEIENGQTIRIQDINNIWESIL